MPAPNLQSKLSKDREEQLKIIMNPPNANSTTGKLNYSKSINLHLSLKFFSSSKIIINSYCFCSYISVIIITNYFYLVREEQLPEKAERESMQWVSMKRKLDDI